MKTERIDEAFLVKYLLGDLPPDQEIQVEDRAFADAEYLTALETAEADLIDSYVRGELSQTQRRRFESRFLVSPQRRRKVAFARDLAKVVAEVKAATPIPATVSGWDALVRLIGGWSPAFQFALALAALVVVVGAVWLVIDNMAMRSRIAGLENPPRQIEPKAEPQPNEAKVPPDNPKGTPPNAIATFIFVPGVPRGPDGPQQLFTLNTSTQLARIEIQLEARDDYPRYRAELGTTSGDEVLVRGNLQRIPTAAGYSVAFEIPASALDSGAYELALKGILADQRVEEIRYYYFAVKKP